jgi:hypothetical protein
MAAPRIKKTKKKAADKVTAVPRQGAIPCLVLVVLALVVIGALIYASIKTAG